MLDRDDRIRCQNCDSYEKSGRCGSAVKRERRDVGERYMPTVDLPHRCIWFMPGELADDKRRGWERYPDMAIEYKERFGNLHTKRIS